LRRWVNLAVLVVALAAIAGQWRMITATWRTVRPRGWRETLFGRR
jgi:hypothetical protein